MTGLLSACEALPSGRATTFDRGASLCLVQPKPAVSRLFSRFVKNLTFAVRGGMNRDGQSYLWYL